VGVDVGFAHQCDQILDWEHDFDSVFEGSADGLQLNNKQVHEFQYFGVVEEGDLHGVLLDLVGLQAELELACLLVLLCEENPSEYMILLNELVHQF
jgi:hypothetical protein